MAVSFNALESRAAKVSCTENPAAPLSEVFENVWEALTMVCNMAASWRRTAVSARGVGSTAPAETPLLCVALLRVLFCVGRAGVAAETRVAGAVFGLSAETASVPEVRAWFATEAAAVEAATTACVATAPSAVVVPGAGAAMDPVAVVAATVCAVLAAEFCPAGEEGALERTEFGSAAESVAPVDELMAATARVAGVATRFREAVRPVSGFRAVRPSVELFSSAWPDAMPADASLCGKTAAAGKESVVPELCDCAWPERLCVDAPRSEEVCADVLPSKPESEPRRPAAVPEDETEAASPPADSLKSVLPSEVSAAPFRFEGSCTGRVAEASAESESVLPFCVSEISAAPWEMNDELKIAVGCAEAADGERSSAAGEEAVAISVFCVPASAVDAFRLPAAPADKPMEPRSVIPSLKPAVVDCAVSRPASAACSETSPGPALCRGQAEEVGSVDAVESPVCPAVESVCEAVVDAAEIVGGVAACASASVGKAD